MTSNSAGRFLRRVTPPPRQPAAAAAQSLDTFWLPSPKEVESPPALLWNTNAMPQVLMKGHETMMGACLLSPKGYASAFPEWKGRCNATEPRETAPAVKEEQLELLEVKTEVEAEAFLVKGEPPESHDSKAWFQWQVLKKRSSFNRKRKEKINWDLDVKPVPDVGIRKRKIKVEKGEEGMFKKPRKIKVEKGEEGMFKKPRVDRWSVDRYLVAERKMVDVVRKLGGRLDTPVLRHVLREEARRHIGDTGLLDHLLKHMVGKVVEDGKERFQRRHNSAGDLEYWLEPADMAKIRCKAGVSNPYWVPPSGWKFGDPIHLSSCSEECKKEKNRIRCEVEALRRVHHDLLQGKGNVENWVDDVAMGSHVTLLDKCLLSPKSTGGSGDSARGKIKLIIKHPGGRPSSYMNLGEAREQQIQMKMNKVDKEGLKNSRHYKKDWMNINEEEKNGGQLMRGSKMNRWSSERYMNACWKLVEIMRELGAKLEKPVMRQELREVARKHIGDTGLLDHLLKHMAGKVVVGGTERLQRRHNMNGAMIYWLEPADLVEIRVKAGVTDPYWAPPPGWQLGDATSPWPCSLECKNEMALLKEEIDTLKRNVERLRALQQSEKQIAHTQSEDGQFSELSEVEEQSGRRDDWKVCS